MSTPNKNFIFPFLGKCFFERNLRPYNYIVNNRLNCEGIILQFRKLFQILNYLQYKGILSLKLCLQYLLIYPYLLTTNSIIFAQNIYVEWISHFVMDSIIISAYIKVTPTLYVLCMTSKYSGLCLQTMRLLLLLS